MAAAILDDDLHLGAGGIVEVAGKSGVDARGVVAAERPAEVEGAAAVVGVGSGGAGVVGGGGEDFPSLGGAERGVGGEDRGECAGDEWSGGGRAIDVDALLVNPRGLDAVAGRGNLELGAGVGKRDLLTDGIDGADGDDAGIGGGPREACGLVVAGGGDDECAVRVGVVDGGEQDVAGGVAAEADVDDFGAGIDGGEDALGHGENIAEPIGVGDADAEERGRGGDAGGIGREAGGEGGDGGAVTGGVGAVGELTGADVEGADAAVEGGVEGVYAAVEDGDGDAAAPRGAVGGGADGGERGVAQRNQVESGAIGGGEFIGDAEVVVGGRVGVVGGVAEDVVLDGGDALVANADRVERVELGDDAQALGGGAGEEAPIGCVVAEGERGFVGAGFGRGEQRAEAGEK